MAKITIEITDEDLKEMQEGLEIVGTDDVAKFQILSQTLMEKVDNVLNENFKNLPILETIDEILDKLEDTDILRTKENIYISEGVNVDLSNFDDEDEFDDDEETEEDRKYYEEQKKKDDLKGYVFRIPATWIRGDEEKRTPILISGGICSGNLSGSHEFSFYVASHSVKDAEIAEKFILNDLKRPDDLKVAELAMYLNIIFSGEIPSELVTDKKQKTFFKAARRLAKKGKFDDLAGTGGVHTYLDDDNISFMMFENLSIIDKLIKRMVKYIRAEGIPLTDEDLKEILANFNYKVSDEWIEEMLKFDNILQFPTKK